MNWKLLGSSLIISLPSNAWAQVPDAYSEPGEEMQVLVKSYVTEHPEVSIDEAITRLAVQTEILQPMADLRREFEGRLTAISIQESPDQHILVQLKGSEPVQGRTLRTQSGTTRVVTETGHKRTEEEFYEVIETHTGLLFSAIPGITGYMGRPGEDLLIVHIEGNEEQVDALAPTVRKLERVLGMSVTLRPNMSQSKNSACILATCPQ